MRRETNKSGYRFIAGALVAIAVVGAAASVKASMAYDGRWNVAINSRDADCRTGAIPVKIENRSGTLNFWSAEKDAFPPELVALLTEVAKAMQ